MLILIGGSLGGVQALSAVLSGLDAAFPAAVVVVLHRAPDLTHGLPSRLQAHSPLPVSEPCDKDPIEPGHVYIAPADYHLLVESDHFALSTEPPVRYARPAVDVLFESAADNLGAEAVGVILTGGNDDGACGLARIKAAGGYAIVQDPATAEGRSMPEAAIAACTVDQVLALERIAPALTALAGGGR